MVQLLLKPLCKQGMKDSLQFLSQMIESGVYKPDILVDCIKIFILEFEPEDYDEENLQDVTRILITAASVDLVQLFITNVLMKMLRYQPVIFSKCILVID